MSILPKDELYDPRNSRERRCVAVSFDTNNPTESWEEIQEHAGGQCRGKEKIGAIIVQLIEPGAKKGRWIDYSTPRPGHEITVNLGLNVKKTDDVHLENITILNTGGPNTEYRLYNPPGVWVCQ